MFSRFIDPVDTLNLTRIESIQQVVNDCLCIPMIDINLSTQLPLTRRTGNGYFYELLEIIASIYNFTALDSLSYDFVQGCIHSKFFNDIAKKNEHESD